MEREIILGMDDYLDKSTIVFGFINNILLLSKS